MTIKNMDLHDVTKIEKVIQLGDNKSKTLKQVYGETPQLKMPRVTKQVYKKRGSIPFSQSNTSEEKTVDENQWVNTIQ